MKFKHTYSYRNQEQENWYCLVSDVKKLFGCLPTAQQLQHDYAIDTSEIILTCPFGLTDPYVETDKIGFNNRSSILEPTIYLHQYGLEDTFQTDSLPYNFVVCGVLVLAYHHFKSLILTSNSRAEEWQPSLDWVQKHTNTAVVMPSSIPPRNKTMRQN